MDNCTLSNRAMYMNGRHDAMGQIIMLIVGVLAVTAVATAIIAVFAPKQKTPSPAPPKYSPTKPIYEESETEVLQPKEIDSSTAEV